MATSTPLSPGVTLLLRYVTSEQNITPTNFCDRPQSCGRTSSPVVIGCHMSRHCTCICVGLNSAFEYSEMLEGNIQDSKGVHDLELGNDSGWYWNSTQMFR